MARQYMQGTPEGMDVRVVSIEANIDARVKKTRVEKQILNAFKKLKWKPRGIHCKAVGKKFIHWKTYQDAPISQSQKQKWRCKMAIKPSYRPKSKVY